MGAADAALGSSGQGRLVKHASGIMGRTSRRPLAGWTLPKQARKTCDLLSTSSHCNVVQHEKGMYNLFVLLVDLVVD